MPDATCLRKAVFACFAVILFSVFPGAAFGQSEEEPSYTQSVVTIGTSSIYGGNVSAARSAAIADSLVSAVSQVSLNLVLFDAMNRDFQIASSLLFGQTNEYIREYKVLNTARTASRYSVIVEATVLVGKMEEKLSAVGVTLRKNALPRVLFFVTEQGYVDPVPRYWWKAEDLQPTIYSESMMALAMAEKGVTIIHPPAVSGSELLESIRYRPAPSLQEMLSIGSHLDADIIVLATAAVEKAANRMGDQTQSYVGTVTAQAIRIETGAEIGLSEQSYIAISEDPAAGGTHALSGAGRLAGEDLAEKVASVWQKKIEEMVGIDILVRWNGNLTRLVELRTAITGTAGVKQLLPRTMDADELLMTVDYEGDEKQLADSLMTIPYSDFGIHIYDVAEGRLGIEIIGID